MVTYIDEATLTGGVTKDTFGTASTFYLNSKARRVIALLTSGCDTTITTAEGGSTQLQVNSSSLGLADQRFQVGPYNEGSATATNIANQVSGQETIPVDWPCGGGEAIAVAAAPTCTKTVGVSLMTGIMYCDVLPPTDWRSQFPLPVPVKGGFVVDASQATTTRTALTAVSIPTWAQEFVGVKATVLHSASLTAGQSNQVVFEVTSTLPDITPMKIPSNSSGPTLGTVTMFPGGGHDQVPIIPVYYKLPGGTQTITPYVNLVAAVTASDSVNFAAYWR